MTLTPEQRQALNANLPPEKVKDREGPGGRALSYVEGWDVIDVLNGILGQGTWGYDTTATIAVPLEERQGKFGPRWCVTYVCKCYLSIEGCESIGDYGVGHGQDKDPGLAIESAIKEAATDSLKRCAKSLGHRLGLALYDKQREHVGEPEPEAPKRPVVSAVDVTLMLGSFAGVKPGEQAKLDKLLARAREVRDGLSDADDALVTDAIKAAKARAATPGPARQGGPAPLSGKRTPAECMSVPELSLYIGQRRDLFSTLPADERALCREELVTAAKRLGIDPKAMLVSANLGPS